MIYTYKLARRPNEIPATTYHTLLEAGFRLKTVDRHRNTLNNYNFEANGYTACVTGHRVDLFLDVLHVAQFDALSKPLPSPFDPRAIATEFAKLPTYQYAKSRRQVARKLAVA